MAGRGRVVLLLLVLAGLLGLGYRLLQPPGPAGDPAVAPLPAFRLDGRPGEGRYLWDYDGSLGHYREAAGRFLDGLRQRHGIEAMILTLPALPEGQQLNTLAVDLLNRWRVGADEGGRGLLLLLVGEQRQARLEVGYALEPLFTDAFSGYIEDLQLAPYYRAGDLGTGLIAVMEEIEQRAELEAQADDRSAIALADDRLLSGGAGASRDLERYAAQPAREPAQGPSTATGAATAEEAWQILLRQWAGDGRASDPDVYTAMTRLAMGDPNRPDPRVVRDLPHWREAAHEVRQNADHAIIWFGRRKGWRNAPFLFCRTPAGWQFDIVHQRILVVMGQAPDWYLAAGDYPYLDLVGDPGLSTRKDIPPLPELAYRCSQDRELFQRMRQLETRTGADAEPADLLELARLRVATAQRPNLVQPLLERLLALDPVPPAALQYAAVYNVNAFLQYRTALGQVESYIEQRPRDPWGHDMRGFLHYRLAQFEAALADHLRALELAPGDGYAHAQLARVYVQLARRAESEVQRRHYRELAGQALVQARVHGERARVRRLEGWVQARLATEG